MHQCYPIVGPKKSSYAYNVLIADGGMPMILVDWCRAKCQEDCGWWFDISGSNCYLGFDHEEDFVLFSLSREVITHG